MSDLPTLPEPEAVRAEALLADLRRMEAVPCSGCAGALCGHERVVSVAMGFKDAPRCLPCLAAALAQDEAALRDRLVDYVLGKDCFREGWLRASRAEGFGDDARPACFGPGGAPPLPAPAAPPSPATHEWDAGDMGCGDLVLELRLRLEAMSPGQTLRLTSRDPGAPEDLPAWCRMTGHALVSGNHPVYFIRRKEG